MPIECMPSNLCSDVRCTICGQGFLVFAGQARESLSGLRDQVQLALRQHHVNSTHPIGGFILQNDSPSPASI